VLAVQNAVENVRSNPDPAMRSLLILGVREARDSLSRQLAQVSGIIKVLSVNILSHL